MLTLVLDCGFHCQCMHCMSVSCWKPQLNTGCDTHWGRTGDICSPQPFLWRRIKKSSAFLDAYFSTCVGAALRDRVGEVYLTKHPQVRSIQIHSRAIKAYFQDVGEGEKKERRLKTSLAAHRESLTLKRERLAFQRWKGGRAKAKWVCRYSLPRGLKWVSEMFAAEYNAVWRRGVCLQSCVLIKTARWAFCARL